MSLRPRYSLLTLLLLTAAIAVGIKLWRGPHRVLLSDPLTSEQQIVVDRLIYFKALKNAYPHVETQLEYLNSWDQRRYYFVKSHTLDSRPIPVIPSESHKNYRVLVYRNPKANREELEQEIETAKFEHVVCWVYNPKFTRTIAPAYQKTADYRSFGYRSDHSTNWCYFITSRKSLYVFHGLLNNGINLKPVELSELEDPEFRQSVAEEFARIPEPKELP